MQQGNQQVIATIIAVVMLLIIISIIVLLLTIYYSNTKKKLLQEKEILKKTHEQAIMELKMEIQEETLTNISREIHDNITQVLSFVKLNLGMIDRVNAGAKTKIEESRELISQSINDLRNLSKSLSFEHIVELGLLKTIEIESDRVNNSGLINTSLIITGEVFPLGEQRELVLFRIFQEALNNTLKYAAAKHFKITLQYSAELFNLTLEDDGKGFSTELLDTKSGQGLKNMANRAALIGAEAIISSSPGKGCCIEVILNPLKQQLYIDGTYSDRFS